MKFNGQSKTHSWLEVWTNIFIGWSINIIAQIIIFPFFNIHIAFHDQLLMGTIFTVISVCRQYILRRIYNHWMLFNHKQQILKT